MLPAKILVRRDEGDPSLPQLTGLFAENKNAASEIARALVIFAIVPYLGILFVPMALVFGAVGYAAAKKRPCEGGQRLSLISIGLSIVLLGVHLVLWWLLLHIPTLHRPT